MTPMMPTFFPSPPRGVWYVGKVWHLDLLGRQLDIGPIPIRAYALCIIAGIIVALLIGDRRWRARGGERGVIYDIALWAVPFGLVGGRLYHLMTDWRTYFGEGGAGFDATLRIWDGGLGIWGAVALGGVGAWIGCRRRGIPLPAFGDAIAPGIVLAQAIGRLGNYFNQELYGRETSQPWGLEIFWRQNAAGLRDPHLLDGVSTGEVYRVVEPTFAYELIWNVLVFLLLIVVDRRWRIGHGRLFALYVAGYCVGRFGIELLRDDTATHIAGIRINSFTSTFVFIGAVVYFLLAKKGREDPAGLAGRAEEEAATEQIPAPEAELVGVGVGSGAGLESGEPLSEDAIDLWSADEVEPDAETDLDVAFEPGLVTEAEPRAETEVIVGATDQIAAETAEAGAEEAAGQIADAGEDSVEAADLTADEAADAPGPEAATEQEEAGREDAGQEEAEQEEAEQEEAEQEEAEERATGSAAAEPEAENAEPEPESDAAEAADTGTDATIDDADSGDSPQITVSAQGDKKPARRRWGRRAR